MKNTFLYSIVLIFSFSLFSCEEDLEIWDSEVLEFSGRFVVELQTENEEQTIIGYHDGMEMQLYNTAENLSDEFWMHEVSEFIPVKSKVFVNGNPSSFESKSMEFADLGNNVLVLDVPTPAPTAVGQSITVDRDYIRSGILEGKILPGAATTIGGNQADSLYLKMQLLSGTVTFNSAEVPVEKRADPDVAEFEWIMESMAYNPDLDETYVIAGHRYTGYPEDHY